MCVCVYLSLVKRSVMAPGGGGGSQATRECGELVRMFGLESSNMGSLWHFQIILPSTL